MKNPRAHSPASLSQFFRRQAQLSVTTKLILAVMIVIILITIAQAAINLSNTQALIEEEQAAKLEGYSSAYLSRVDEAVNAAAALSTSFANRPDIRDLYLAGDREGLIRLLEPIYLTLKTRYQFSHLYIHNSDGTVFLRVHNPASFGDNVLYRNTAATAIQDHKTAAGIEIGANRIGVRGVTPMLDANGDFIGAVEVGLDYDQSFLRALKEATEADFGMWISKREAEVTGLKPLADALPSPTDEMFSYTYTKTDLGKASPENYAYTLKTGLPRTEIILENVREPQIVLLVPIRKYGGAVIGVLEISKSYLPTVSVIANTQSNIITVSLIIVLASGLALWLLSYYTITRPLGSLAAFAIREGKGERGARVNLRTGDEFESLAATFNSMAEAIEKNRFELEARVEQRTAQLRTTNEVARVASSILDPNTLINQVVNLITQRFGYYYASIFLIGNEGRWAVLKDATGTAGQTLKARRHQLEVGGQSMVGTAISLKQARIALDAGEAPVRFDNPLLPETRSEIALPMMVGDRVLGALDVQSKQGNAFSNEDIETLQSMANQVAVALENARLFQETREALEEIRTVYSQYVISTWSDKIRTSDLSAVAEDSSAALSINPESYPLKIPLMLRDQILGHIQIESEAEWTPDEKAWLEAAASQIAITLDNARLIEESQQSALRDRLAAAITEKIWSAQSIDGILQTAARELGRAMEASEAFIELKVNEERSKS
jgi:GAF domain-containing protein/HAMP domain-containing protein